MRWLSGCRAHAVACVLVCVLACILCTSGTTAALAGAPQQASAVNPLPVHVGGARLLFLDSDSDMGSIFALMLAGSGNQRSDEAHVAHVSEHMVFMNPGADGRSLAQYVSGVGGIYNGWTGPDHTQFELTIPPAEIPTALGRLIDGLFASGIDAGALTDELTKRLSPELKFMTTNSVSGPLNAAQLAMFRGTRYDEQRFIVPVTAVTPAGVEAFRQREYSPARLLIVICAKVSQAAVQDAMANALIDIPAGAQPAVTAVTLSPVNLSTVITDGAMSPRIVTGLVFNSVKPESRVAAHMAAVLIANRVRDGGVAGLTQVPKIFALQPMDGAEGLLVGFARSGLGALFADEERLGTAARDAVEAAWVSLRDQGPTEAEVADILSSWGQTGSYPETVPESLIKAFNAGIRYVPGTGAIMLQMDSPVTKDQLRQDMAEFLASCEVSKPFSVFLEGEAYKRTVVTRIVIGLAVLLGLAILVRTRRPRRIAS